MSKAIYVGVAEKARKVPKLYVGVDGVARKVKKGYIGVNGVARLFYAPQTRPPRLPAGYTELEYVYTSNGQYIDTKLKPYEDTKIVLNAQLIDAVGVGSSGTIVDSAASYTSSGVSHLGMFTAAFSKENDISCTIGYSANWSVSKFVSVKIAAGMVTPFELIMNGNGDISINGIEYHANVANGFSYVDYNANRMSNITLCDTYGDRKNTKIYSCQIYKGTELLLDLVPCKNAAGMVGMYDLVGDSLFSSASNTSFLAGPAI